MQWLGVSKDFLGKKTIGLFRWISQHIGKMFFFKLMMENHLYILFILTYTSQVENKPSSFITVHKIHVSLDLYLYTWCVYSKENAILKKKSVVNLYSFFPQEIKSPMSWIVCLLLTHLEIPKYPLYLLSGNLVCNFLCEKEHLFLHNLSNPGPPLDIHF